MFKVNERYPEVLKKWSDYLEGNRKKETTIESYVRWSAEFLKYIRKEKYKIKGEIEKINISKISDKIFTSIKVLDIESYKLYLIKEKKNTGVTVNRKLAALENLYDFLKLCEIIDTNIIKTDIKRAEEDTKQKKPLSLESTKLLLKTIKETDKTFSVRNYTMFVLLVDCGFRKEELANLKMKQIKNLNSITFEGKGAKERTISLANDSIPVLEEYLKWREEYLYNCNKESDYVFINRSCKQIKSIGRILKEYTDELEIGECTPHTLRRTAATLRHKYGNVDTKALQKMLGHSSISTTQRYVELDEEEMKQVANSMPKII